jgi:hypothetical protein
MRRKTDGIETTLRFAAKAYDDTAQAIIEAGGHLATSDEPRRAWERCLPVLADRASIQAYIACVADGLARRYISPDRAKVLLYTAQLALAAHSERGKKLWRK